MATAPILMSHKGSIELQLSPQELESFCQVLLDKSRDIAKTHAALQTLESFVLQFSRLKNNNDGRYGELKSALNSVLEKSHHRLLQQSACELYRALTACDVVALAVVHMSLSRNDFYTILKEVIGDLSDDEIRVIMVWSSHWVHEARKLVADISGDPDSEDFSAAGVRVEEFRAINAIDRVLNFND